MRIIKGRGTNILRGLFHTSPDFIGEFMETGKFYFIKDVTINENLQKELDRTVTKVINLYKRGTKIVLTDLDTILKDLI